MLTEYTARNQTALDTLVNKHKVDLRKLPDDVLNKLHALSVDVVADVAAKDPMSNKVYQSFDKFSKQVKNWTDISERAYLNVR